MASTYHKRTSVFSFDSLMIPIGPVSGLRCPPAKKALARIKKVSYMDSQKTCLYVVIILELPQNLQVLHLFLLVVTTFDPYSHGSAQAASAEQQNLQGIVGSEGRPSPSCQLRNKNLLVFFQGMSQVWGHCPHHLTHFGENVQPNSSPPTGLASRNPRIDRSTSWCIWLDVLRAGASEVTWIEGCGATLH